MHVGWESGEAGGSDDEKLGHGFYGGEGGEEGTFGAKKKRELSGAFSSSSFFAIGRHWETN